MRMRNKVINFKSTKVDKIEKEIQLEKNNILIIGGVIVAITSIGLLIFVLSEKVFT